MRDTLYASARALVSLAPGEIVADTTSNGAAIDTNLNAQNFRVATVIAFTGAWTDGEYAVSVEESANGTTGWAAVPASRLQGSGTLDASNSVVEIGVVPDAGNARYLRAVVTSSDVTAGATVGALILLSTPGQEPVIR